MAASDLSVLSGTPLEVAPLLLGAVLSKGDVAVRLTEVEAYEGADDPGSHAFRGRTPRNEVMFGPSGRLYTYFIYGMYVCANVVCGPDGRAGAVLVRAGEVIRGKEDARLRRPKSPDHMLARGPARLCNALGIGLADYGVDLSTGPVRLELATGGGAVPRVVDPARARPGDVVRGPRVGLRNAAERPWRFWFAGDPTVSTYRPAAPRRTGGSGARRGRPPLAGE